MWVSIQRGVIAPYFFKNREKERVKEEINQKTAEVVSVRVTYMDGFLGTVELMDLC